MDIGESVVAQSDDRESRRGSIVVQANLDNDRDSRRGISVEFCTVGGVAQIRRPQCYGGAGMHMHTGTCAVGSGRLTVGSERSGMHKHMYTYA